MKSLRESPYRSMQIEINNKIRSKKLPEAVVQVLGEKALGSVSLTL
jgi:hypothetical protein